MSIITGNLVSLIAGALLWLLAISLENSVRIPARGFFHAAEDAIRTNAEWIWNRRRHALPGLAVTLLAFGDYTSPQDAVLLAIGAFLACFSVAYTVKVEAMARNSGAAGRRGE